MVMVLVLGVGPDTRVLDDDHTAYVAHPACTRAGAARRVSGAVSQTLRAAAAVGPHFGCGNCQGCKAINHSGAWKIVVVSGVCA